MPIEEVRGLIGYIGLITQTAGVVLVVALFIVLRRYADRRPYFTYWSRSWLALAAALIALIVRYQLLTRFSDNTTGGDPTVIALYAIYQAGKLLHLAYLVLGTAIYTHGFRSPRALPIATVGIVGFALATTLNVANLDEVIIWQAPVAAAAYGFSGYALLRLPASRRALGTAAAGVVLGVMAIQWLFYLVSFSGPRLWPALDFTHPIYVLVSYNSYFDLLLEVILGYGMVLILMEDSKREVDAAHTELGLAHQELRRISLYDSLTGALNRRAYVEGIGLDHARGSFGTVVAMDLDHLKEVNDTCGHAAGDALLCHAAAVLRAGLRPSDKVYRWGGDEFLIIIPGARARQVQPRIETLLAEAPPVVHGTPPRELRVHASVGAADYSGAEDIESAILRADDAMYEQKAARRRSLSARATVGPPLPAD